MAPLETSKKWKQACDLSPKRLKSKWPLFLYQPPRFFDIFHLLHFLKINFERKKNPACLFLFVLFIRLPFSSPSRLDSVAEGERKSVKKSGWLFFKRAWPNIETIFAEKLDELDNFCPAFYVWTYNHSENSFKYFLIFQLII